MIHIVGGAGFLGTAIAQQLESEGLPFKIFDKALKDSEYVDVTNPDSLKKMGPTETLINLAAEHKDDVRPVDLYHRVNVDGARDICEYCRENGVNTIIFTSSVAVYGAISAPATEQTPRNPDTAYGESKKKAEDIYLEWAKEQPASRTLIIVRPTAIFGEGNRGNVHRLLYQIARRRFVMFGAGRNKKSLAYVDNVAEFILFSMRLKGGVHIYNYADKPDLEMKSLVRTVRAKLFNRDDIGPRLPGWLGIAIGAAFDVAATALRKDFPVSAARVKKFMAPTVIDSQAHQIGFKASISLTEGLDKTLSREFSSKL